MVTYYEMMGDGRVGRFTTDQDAARDAGLVLSTERNVVQGWNGCWYFEGEVPPRRYCAQDYDDALEEHLMSERVARGYTSRSPAEYAGSSNERWAQDAADWVAHVTAVMEYGLGIENMAKAGEDVPGLSEFRDGLPRIAWTFKEAGR